MLFLAPEEIFRSFIFGLQQILPNIYVVINSVLFDFGLVCFVYILDERKIHPLSVNIVFYTPENVIVCVTFERCFHLRHIYVNKFLTTLFKLSTHD